METTIIFQPPIRETLENFKTGEICTLNSNNDPSQFTREDKEKIISICNQKPVYDFLFRQRLQGKVYQLENAESFINWMAEGWREQKGFVFLIRNSHNEIIAAADIKSNNLDRSEIGYWADENHPGIMTRAIEKLCQLAKAAGYKKLFALIKTENNKSQNVVIRNGFIQNDQKEEPEGTHFIFEKEL